MKDRVRSVVIEYGILTLATIVLIMGNYLFKFPNHFSFGGVTGIAVILTAFIPLSASALTFIMNIALLVVGFVFLDRSFGIKTVYVTILFSVGLEIAELIYPMSGPLTNQPLLELLFAIVMPALSSAIFFHEGASSGGTDIVAMIMKKYTSVDIGISLIIVDAVVAISGFVFYGPAAGLCSVTGLLAKSLVIDQAIANMNLCKYFTIVCDDEEPICDFIHETLNRSATVYHAQGSYSHKDKAIVLTVMKRSQAVQLRNFIKRTQPTAFLMITNSSEIMGKGFSTLF